jgi:hypothetical protein
MMSPAPNVLRLACHAELRKVAVSLGVGGLGEDGEEEHFHDRPTGGFGFPALSFHVQSVLPGQNASRGNCQGNGDRVGQLSAWKRAGLRTAGKILKNILNGRRIILCWCDVPGRGECRVGLDRRRNHKIICDSVSLI